MSFKADCRLFGVPIFVKDNFVQPEQGKKAGLQPGSNIHNGRKISIARNGQGLGQVGTEMRVLNTYCLTTSLKILI